MENEGIEIQQAPKVVLDYKNNALNAVITTIIGITITGIAQYFANRFENRRKKIDSQTVDTDIPKKK